MNPLKMTQKREKSPILVAKGQEGRWSLHHVVGLMTQVRPRKPKTGVVQDCTDLAKPK